MSKNNDTLSNSDFFNLDPLYNRITNHIHQARRSILQSIHTEMLTAYWHIGREIVEEEQQGLVRAEYGKRLMQQLATRLKGEFGKGYGLSTLADIRKFYLIYSQEDSENFHAVRGDFTLSFKPNLSWTHYRLLMRIKSQAIRTFYEVEASANCWSSRELERQINSLLYERLAKSKDKEGLLSLAKKGQEIAIPADAIKDPMILEFINISESPQLVESQLEQALISNLQHFLLELGKGFAFIARQKRITLNGDHFYVDLVFYHAILKCYVLVDLKVRKLTHGDLGQMQFYINYFDQEIVTEGDNPTIGLILCTEKNDAMVQYTLADKNDKIFASRYQFHLPSEEELKRELKRELMLMQEEEEKEKGIVT